MKKNCLFCGEEINFDQNICPECGLTQSETTADETFRICPVCQAENPSDANYCLYCCSIFK